MLGDKLALGDCDGLGEGEILGEKLGLIDGDKDADGD